jgi:hypothetical protein
VPRVSVTITAAQKTEVNLTTQVAAMLKARCEEHAAIGKKIAELKSRQGRIQGEVEELFTKAEQEAALADGTTIDGFKVKRVCGTSKKLDKMALISALDITPEELEAFFEEKANKPYIRITAPGQRSEDE